MKESMLNNFEQKISQSLYMTDKLHQALSSMLNEKRSPQTNHTKAYQSTINKNYEAYGNTLPNHKKKHEIYESTINTNEKQIRERIQLQNLALSQQNQMLKEENQQIKLKMREQREQIRNCKKYIKFLEDYNDNLKKEVILWMSRPAKIEQFAINNNNNSHNIVQTSQRPNFTDSFSLASHLLNPEQKINHQDSQQEDQTLIMRLPNLSTVNEPQSYEIINKNKCTSCNYLKNKKKQRKDNLPKTTINISNKKQSKNKKRTYSQLCECHRKYVQLKHF